MSQTPNQKNIIHGSITAGGNVRIGDDYITYHNYFAAQEVKIPHRLTNNIPTNADHILGRATELAQAHDHLAQRQATVFFNGIGGIGKTALASKYMAVYGSDYKHLAWITVQSTLAEAFTNNAPLLASLQITQQVQDYIAAKQLDKAFEFLFHQLNLLERILVVVDNANDLDDLDQYKNWFDTANCHFLITSRSQPSEWATVEVDSLPEDEAVRLFKKLHPSVSADDAAIKNLLSKLFYHTLLIELVAKAGASTGIPFADLQTMIETKFIHDEQLNEDIVNTGKHGNYYETKRAKIEEYIWLIFSNVKDLGTDATQILRGMALLPLATPFEREFLKTHLALFEVKDVVANLSLLVERGWLQKDGMSYKIHPLIAKIIITNLRVDIDFSQSYINHINTCLKIQNYDNPVEFFPLKAYEHLATRLTAIFFNTKHELICRLHNLFSNYCNVYERYSDAIYHAECSCHIAESLPNLDKETLLEYQIDLARLYSKMNRFGESLIFFEKNLNLSEEIYGLNSKEYSLYQIDLAGEYSTLGFFAESSVLYTKALANIEVNFKEDYENIISIKLDLARLYVKLRKNDEAISLIDEAFLCSEANQHSGSEEFIMTQLLIANSYHDALEIYTALNINEEIVSLSIKNLGFDNYITVASQVQLARIYMVINRIDDSVDLLKKSMSFFDSYYEFEDNEMRFLIYYNLCFAYNKQKRYKEAIEIAKKFLAYSEEKYGKKHLKVAERLSYLSGLYSKLGQIEDADKLRQKAYQIQVEILGENHPDLQKAINPITQVESTKKNDLKLLFLKLSESVKRFFR